jgi:hypothetical protein
MTRKIAICIGVPALIAAAALAVTANGQSRPATITLHAKSQLEHVHGVDNPPAGHSAGDQLIFTERLLNNDGHVIGHDAASCTSLFGKRSLCTGAYVLHGGQIMVQLRQPGLGGTVTYTQVITGGTRRFDRATGSVTVDQQPSGDRFTFNIHLPK